MSSFLLHAIGSWSIAATTHPVSISSSSLPVCSPAFHHGINLQRPTSTLFHIVVSDQQSLHISFLWLLHYFFFFQAQDPLVLFLPSARQPATLLPIPQCPRHLLQLHSLHSLPLDLQLQTISLCIPATLTLYNKYLVFYNSQVQVQHLSSAELNVYSLTKKVFKS